MKMKTLVLLIAFVMMVSIVSGKVSIDPITEESFIYNENSKSNIKEKGPVTISITPFLSSGEKLNRKINEKELPINTPVTNLVEHINNGVKRTKIVQIYPESVLEMSDDAETIKQSSPNDGKIKVELYYGYQKSIDQPWDKYYKVENCGLGFCRVVRADFNMRVVSIEEITVAQANGILIIKKIY